MLDYAEAFLTDSEEIAADLGVASYEVPILVAKQVSYGWKIAKWSDDQNSESVTESQLGAFKRFVLFTSKNRYWAEKLGYQKCLEPRDWSERDTWYKSFRDLYGAIEHCRELIADGIEGLIDASPNLEMWYHEGPPRGWDIQGMPELAKLYRPYGGQVTVVTGIPGHGKSEMLDQILVKLSQKYDMRFAIYSPENSPAEFHAIKMMEKYLVMPFADGPTPRMRVDQMKKAGQWVNDRFKRLKVSNIPELLKMTRYAIDRWEISGLVLDPWNQIEHSRPERISETDYISKSLTEIKQFAVKHNIHVWIIAHPAKIMPDPKNPTKKRVPTPYDINGSANWFNKADNIFTVYRHYNPEEEGLNYSVEVHVQKIKQKNLGQIGIAYFAYDRPTGCYYEVRPEEKS